MPQRLAFLWMLSLSLGFGSACRAEVTDHPEPTQSTHFGRGYLRLLTIDPSPVQAPNAAPLEPLSSIMQAPNLPPRPNDPHPSPVSAQRPSEKLVLPGAASPLLAQQSPGEGESEGISAAALENHQLFRDQMFNTLKASAAGYTFDYVVITLPADSVPGIHVPIPVSHIRYRETVLFGFDKYSLEPRGEVAVLDFAKAINRDKSIRSILIVGHTDSIGTDEYNVILSKNRANAVAAVLLNNGITEKYLGLVPMGKAQPLTTNKTSGGRALNRRVEFFIADIPEATEKAAEQIAFNPCDIENHETAPDSKCPPPQPIPVYAATGGPPIAQLDLARGAIPSPFDMLRPPIPVEPQQHTRIPSE
jgi:outer membrane protein OmpA-like peptidoglycan-associated protein